MTGPSANYRRTELESGSIAPGVFTFFSFYTFVSSLSSFPIASFFIHSFTDVLSTYLHLISLMTHLRWTLFFSLHVLTERLNTTKVRLLTQHKTAVRITHGMVNAARAGRGELVPAAAQPHALLSFLYFLHNLPPLGVCPRYFPFSAFLLSLYLY